MIYLALPAYNEEQALPLLLQNAQEKMKGLAYKVIVVDDGSKDGTVKAAKSFQDKMPLILIEHGKNQGLGRAMATIFDYSGKNAREEDFLVTMDADNTHDPELIRKMMTEMNNADIVVASRYCRGGEQVGVNLFRRWLSRGVNFFMKILFPITGADDYSCGYRLYRTTLIKQALSTYGDDLISNNGFGCMPEILIKLAALGARVKEVPLYLRYDLKKSQSKLRLGNILIEYINLVFSIKKSIKEHSKQI